MAGMNRMCGCGLRGSGTLVRRTRELSVWKVQSDQSQACHTSIVAWCADCHRMEWRCRDAGKGRFCAATEKKLI